MSKGFKTFTHRWQFVSADFAGWPDGKPWTRVVPGPHDKSPWTESPAGEERSMPQQWIDMIAVFLEELVEDFLRVKNTEEAAWRRARTRSPERPMLIRTRVVDVPTEVPVA